MRERGGDELFDPSYNNPWTCYLIGYVCARSSPSRSSPIPLHTQLAVKVPKTAPRELEEAERELRVDKNVTCPRFSGTGNYW